MRVASLARVGRCLIMAAEEEAWEDDVEAETASGLQVAAESNASTSHDEPGTTSEPQVEVDASESFSSAGPQPSSAR